MFKKLTLFFGNIFLIISLFSTQHPVEKDAYQRSVQADNERGIGFMILVYTGYTIAKNGLPFKNRFPNKIAGVLSTGIALALGSTLFAHGQYLSTKK